MDHDNARCGGKPTGRRRYASATDAFKALERIQNQPHNPDKPLDTFYRPTSVRSCPKCRGFHLTSKSPKRNAKGKRSRDLKIRKR